MSETQVIIIGAGISGLSAANRLVENGLNNFLILEASNRVGGRIHTMSFQNSFIEIGAQWMHGTENNPVYEIGVSLDAIDEDTVKADEMYYSTQDGTKLDENLVESIQNEAQNLIEGFPELYSSDENELDSQKSIGDLLDEAYKKIKDKFGSEAEDELLKGIYRAQFNNERFESACDDLHNLSASCWINYETLGGNQFTNNKYGYEKITDYLKSKVSRDSIILNQVVEKIDWSDDLVKLTAFDNNEKKRKTYIARAVLCTIPLGCLKKTHQQLFTPKLPLIKQNAIDRIGFGLVNKIFVIFDQNFPKNFQGVQIIWRDDVDFKLEKSRKKWNLTNNEFYKAFDNFDKLPNHKNILLGFTAGENAEFIEKLEDDCILDVITELLERCFPYANLPKPVKLIRSRWASNAFSRGSYSFFKVGSSIEDMEIIAEALDNKVYFAGEATINKFPGTVHGAFISGDRAANEILSGLENH